MNISDRSWRNMVIKGHARYWEVNFCEEAKLSA